MKPTYTNPVLARNFPDPFVLKFNGRYYAFGTGAAGDGRALQLAFSPDLVTWEWHGGILDLLPDTLAEDYWAPEVAYHNGTFYLYYAVTPKGTVAHHLRLATAEQPLGPYRDAGLDLTPRELFAIDAHPFQDEDGQWYLFYARDWLERPRSGTGLAVDRLPDFTRLAGQPERVLRPFAEWQLFERRRAEKWGLDWYTVEGPFVVRRRGKYVCFYSGGRWERPGYGVGFAAAERPHRGGDLRAPDWQHPGDAEGAPLLRTSEEGALGPGHNSLVRAPNNIHEYLVYHAWDEQQTAPDEHRAVGAGRTLRLERLEWNLTTPVCEGATVTPRPAPALPSFLDRFDQPGSALGPGWDAAGDRWSQADGVARAAPGERETAALLRDHASRYALLEVNLRSPAGTGRLGAVCAAAGAGQDSQELQEGEVCAWVDLDRRELRLERVGSGEWGVGSTESRSPNLPSPQPPISQAPNLPSPNLPSPNSQPPTPNSAALPPDFRPAAWHRLLLRRNGEFWEATLDGFPRVSLRADLPPTRCGIAAAGGAAEFASAALTHHFRDEFLGGDGGDWEFHGGDWSAEDGCLRQRDPAAPDSRATKGDAFPALEVSASIRPGAGEGRCGLLLLPEDSLTATAAWLRPAAAGLQVELRLEGAADSQAQRFPVPPSLEPDGFHHLRLVRQGGRDTLYVNGREVGSRPSDGARARLALVTANLAAEFTGVTATALPQP